MSDLRLVVVGAAGRMGRMLTQTIPDTLGVRLVGRARGGRLARRLAPTAAPLSACRQRASPSRATSTPRSPRPTPSSTSPRRPPPWPWPGRRREARVAHVIGTTGLSADDLAVVAEEARETVVVRSGNMSLGVNLLAVLVEKAAKALGPAWDAEIVEMHHKLKVDAPSGTALLLGEAVARGQGHRSRRAQRARPRRAHRSAQGRRHRLSRRCAAARWSATIR